jgi:hypothetical protein
MMHVVIVRDTYRTALIHSFTHIMGPHTAPYMRIYCDTDPECTMKSQFNDNHTFKDVVTLKYLEQH